MPEVDHIWCRATARPRRTAFIVSAADPHALEQVEDIVEYSGRCWGGAYNPIIPLAGDSVPPGYLKLLHAYDPDNIHCYCDLPQALMTKLQGKIEPIHFTRHTGGQVVSGIGMADEQVPTKALLPHIGRVLSAPMAQLMLVGTSEIQDSDCRSFVRHNIGLFDEEHWERKQDLWVPVYPLMGHSIAAILGELSTKDQLLYPCELARLAVAPAVSFNPVGDHRLQIRVGDDPLTLIDHWNSTLATSYSPRHFSRNLWLNTRWLGTDECVDSLGAFLKHRCFPNSPVFGGVELIYYDSALEGLVERQAERLRESSGLVIQSVVSAEHDLPFEIREDQTHQEAAEPNALQVLASGKNPVIPVPKPAFVSRPDTDKLICSASLSGFGHTSTRYMVDVKMQYHPERFGHTSRKTYWRLPLKPGLESLFCCGLPARIDRQGALCVEVSELVPHLELTIPTDFDVLSTATACAEYHTRVDIRTTVSKRPTAVVGLSDKGKYVEGLLGLFPNLWHAGCFFMNHYWRATVETMLGVGGRREDSVRRRVEAKIKSYQQDIFGCSESDRSGRVSWLADLCVECARDVRQARSETDFAWLAERLVKERAAFVQNLPNNRPRYRTTREQDEAHLREKLQELCSGGIFLPGFRPRCAMCGSAFWLALDQAAPHIVCPGCQHEFTMPVEQSWAYRLNQLVANAVTLHGSIPVVWTLHELQQRGRGSFVYAPGIHVYTSFEAPTPIHEVDILCVVEGKLAACEVKTQSRGFSPSEVGKFAEACRFLGVQLAILSAFRGTQRSLDRHLRKLKEQLGDSGVECQAMLAPQDIDKPSYHIE